MADDVLYDVSPGMAWMTLNRPQEGNRITQPVAEKIIAQLEKAEEDPVIRVVVLTGAGDSFCVGAEIATGGGMLLSGKEVVKAVASVTKPVLAALNGDTLAEGLELALACDIRIAVAGAGFGLPQIHAGRIPCWGGTQRLPRILGMAKALELILTGETIEAAEALRVGLINHMVPRDHLRETVSALTEMLLAKGPVALRYGKEAVYKGMDLTLDQGLRLEEDLYVLLQTTADREEGIRAFLDKRKPQFRGQ